MSKALIVTLGTGVRVEHGIAKSIKDNNPDLIYFLATQISQSTIPRIENVLGYKLENYELHFIKQRDDVEHCYQETSKVIKELIENGFSMEDIYVDFTSGTKAMSAGAALAAAFLECGGMVYVAGERERGLTGRVISGKERLISLTPVEFFIDYRRKQLLELFNSYQFEGCLKIIEDIKRKTSAQEILNEFEMLGNLILVYFNWDKFHHKESKKYLFTLPRTINKKWSIQIDKNKGFIGKLSGNLDKWEKSKKIQDKYSEEQLADLLTNAQRRAEEAKYDDAVARLYRAVELIEQILLAKRGIDTSNVKLKDLPKEWQEKYKDQEKIQLAQRQAFELLKNFGENIGQKFKENKRLRNYLKYRNESILAHGLTSISQDTYTQLSKEVIQFSLSTFPRVAKLMKEAKFPKLLLI